MKTLDPATQEMLDRALEKVVEGTDSNITLVPGYKRKLYKAIMESLQYADQLIEQIPRPIELSGNKLISDPYVRAFFYTNNGLQKACEQSYELKAFFQEHESSESCALLCMRKVEKTVLGMQLEGDQVLRDVKQTRVSFENHRIQSPAEDESTARKELKCCIFEGLVTNALSDISALRARRRQLQTEQQRLTGRLRTKNHVEIAKGVSHLDYMEGMGAGSGEGKLEWIERELDQIGYITPEASLNQVNATFEHPEDFIGMKKLSINLDTSGILRSGNDQARLVNKLNLFEVTIKGQPSRVVTLVKISSAELGSREFRFPRVI